MKFYLGQRVRKVRYLSKDPRPDRPIGIEGRIFSFGDFPIGTRCRNGDILDFNGNCTVIWDGSTNDSSASHTDQLEPIQSHEAGSWSVIEDLCPFLRERVT